ncbi:PREDICTED: uncharacterized protein LOC109584088 [Amphimedon queenslandica]|uniref:HECT domain-containing protein n=1 Tax=Amphimedon queenslandica TaxID=400682 RepID=A0AAN0JEM4_AMPQE|nr:PREDICTED: uncharacterized protein LOC109584088 [Amphimedon queenslandica]|eukprot:XP_019855226.1 PREDICTED: uncharacterized protein LOC109584088 [Amphimedon queenslandica]
MNEDEVRTEICEVFAAPMGLTVDDIKTGKRFNYTYLLRSGCNSRSLCVPTVKDTFQWTGKQVASLAKSGSFIYILAKELLPAWESFMEPIDVISDDDDRDLMPLPKRFFSRRFVTITFDQFYCCDYSNDVSVKDDGDDDDIIITELPPSDNPSPTSSGNNLILPTSQSQSLSSSLDTVFHPPYLSFPSSSNSSQGMSQLLDMFSSSLTEKQIEAIYLLSGSNYAASVSCLAEGPTLSSIQQMCKLRFSNLPSRKVAVNSDTLWEDMVAEYKGGAICHSKLRISIDNQPAIDTGGVRRQVYTTIFQLFASNSHVHLFDDPSNCVRPSSSAIAKLSGLLKILGTMIAHCFCQEGFGFPYLSPVCYLYN